MPVKQDHSDDDPSDMVQQSQERIYELRRDRENRLDNVVALNNAAIKDALARFKTAREEKEKKIAEEQAQQVEGILSKVEFRKKLEEEAMNVVREAHKLMFGMEELMEEGFKGREKDAVKHLDEKVIKKECD